MTNFATHIHTIPVDPALTPDEAWHEIRVFGLRVTYTGDHTWASINCADEPCGEMLY